MDTMPLWIQILIGFGGFTVLNIITMAILWGRMQEVLKSHTDQFEKDARRFCQIEARLDPNDPDLRFITFKDCANKQATIVLGISDIKNMIGAMDTRHEARINRIDLRWESNLKEIYKLTGRVDFVENEAK